MGLDVTYHPIDPAWAEGAFLSLVPAARARDLSHARQLAADAGLGQDARDLYLSLLSAAASWDDPAAPFEAGWGYALCAAQTCFGPYWYTRGSSLTGFLGAPGAPAGLAADLGGEPALSHLPPNPREGRITQNYRSGAWLPPASVGRLLSLLGSDPAVSSAFRAAFPGGQSEVVGSALGWAREHGCGLMEAADLVVPDPVDPRGTEATCWLPNLDLAGVRLYAAEAERQLRGAGAPYDEMTRGVPRWFDL
ncbi:hypothetical protein [Olsenella sp. Marseille-P4559]|uniref:hypothetical protein n=1 Tax=Olsenella sp. Marseille-P4559 TaxID=2364795 RepID=UPI0013EF41C8|nr:hypothetical protein [Olsenella sp. Marseille-P4559]